MILITTNCLCQTKLDSLVILEINKYRASKNIDILNLSEVNFKASNHHSIYLLNNNKFSHSEDTLVEPIDRFCFYGGKTSYIGENIAYISINVNQDIDLYKISKEIVHMWISSVEHNKILLNKNFIFIGVSCVLKYKNSGISGIRNITIISTLVLTK